MLIRNVIRLLYVKGSAIIEIINKKKKKNFNISYKNKSYLIVQNFTVKIIFKIVSALITLCDYNMTKVNIFKNLRIFKVPYLYKYEV